MRHLLIALLSIPLIAQTAGKPVKKRHVDDVKRVLWQIDTERQWNRENLQRLTMALVKLRKRTDTTEAQRSIIDDGLFGEGHGDIKAFDGGNAFYEDPGTRKPNYVDHLKIMLDEMGRLGYR